MKKRMLSVFTLGLVLFSFALSITPAICQTSPPEIRTATFYSPTKYKLTPASSNGKSMPDSRRNRFDFITGNYGDHDGRWDLGYNAIVIGHDADWFLVGTDGDQQRSVIKDLGKLGWDEKFTVPVVPPLPALKPGEHRTLQISTSAGARSAATGLPLEVRGAPSARYRRNNLPMEDMPELHTVPPTGPGKPKLKKTDDPVLVKAVLGHMYVIHIMDGQTDAYVLFHVDSLTPGDNCTISWRWISGSTPAAAPTSTTHSVPVTGGSYSALNYQGLESMKESAAPGGAAPTSEKPTLKDFGSSIDRLKWDQEKQAAVEINGSKMEPGAENSDDVVRIDTRLVISDVLVLDQKGRSIEGLTQNDFIVNEDGQPQQISHFSRGDDVKIGRSIVLILDYSPSLSPYIGLSAGAAQKLIDQLGPKDRMAIVTDDVKLLVDFTGNKAELSRAIDLLVNEVKSNRFGKSKQFSALLATILELFNVEDVRPIIIFQTDGDQLGYMQPVDPVKALNPRFHEKIVQFSLNDVNSAVEKSRRITIYSVIPGLRLIGLPPSVQAERADKILANDVFTAYQRRLQSNPTLPPPAPVSLTAEDSAHNAAVRLEMQQAAAGVAEITGGKTFFLEQPEQAENIYSQILSDVNHRYVFGYYPASKAVDGKRRHVKVEVRNHPEYTVEGRKSYIPAVSP